jgi:hypothetical protein
MVTKKEFFTHMSELYDEDYNNQELYKTFKSIVKVKDKDQIRELQELIGMDTKRRLLYRHALATNGKELTPRQVDQYISAIEFAISNME